MSLMKATIVIAVFALTIIWAFPQAGNKPGKVESSSATFLVSDEDSIRDVLLEYIELSDQGNLEDLKKLIAYPPPEYWNSQYHGPEVADSNGSQKTGNLSAPHSERTSTKPWTYYDTFDYRNLTEFLPKVIIGKYKAEKIFQITGKGDLGNATVEFASLRVSKYKFSQKFSLCKSDDKWKIYMVR